MAFSFETGNSSSDDDAAGDVSTWQINASRKQRTPPRRTSGFQAVNRPVQERIAMRSTPDPESPPPQARAPTTQKEPVSQPTVIPSGEESSSEEDDVHEEEVAPPTAEPVAIEESENEGTPLHEQDQEKFSDALEDLEHLREPSEQNAEDGDDLVVPESTLEVFIPHNEIDEEELGQFEDFTAGGDVVLRVLNEREGEDGIMAYAVEFEDRHVDEVRLACDHTRILLI